VPPPRPIEARGDGPFWDPRKEPVDCGLVSGLGDWVRLETLEKLEAENSEAVYVEEAWEDP